MRDNLNTINRRKGEAESAFRQLPTPSRKYSDCYQKLRALSNLHGEICSLANAYSTHFPDFRERLSNMNFEFNKTMEEVNACRNSLR
jgi:hypothetical protein